MEASVTERKKTDQNYFVEGQDAYRAGRHKTSNPYTEANAEMQWDNGWDSEAEAHQGGSN
jgi:ribosome modulation factor